MITGLPIYVYVVFAFAVLFSLVMFYFASQKSAKFIIAISLWGALHSILILSGFYDNTETIPPRFLLVVLPIIIIVLSSVFSSKMKNWLSTFDLKTLTYLHTVRLPVEFVLYWLFIGGYVPELMSFEGQNFDVLIGITAPVIALIAFKGNQVNKRLLMIWNLVSICLLANIIILAILSMPTRLQQFAFDQPNVAVLKVPFVLLPSIIVPIVMISILAGFVILSKKE